MIYITVLYRPGKNIPFIKGLTPIKQTLSTQKLKGVVKTTIAKMFIISLVLKMREIQAKGFDFILFYYG